MLGMPPAPQDLWPGSGGQGMLPEGLPRVSFTPQDMPCLWGQPEAGWAWGVTSERRGPCAGMASGCSREAWWYR